MDEVELREITFETVRSIVDLDVDEAQTDYVASNAVSLAEAQFNPGSWFRAIYSDGLPVGFVMLFDPSVPGAISRGAISSNEIGLWRLMIDRRYQRRGLGRMTVDLVCDYARHSTRATTLLSSYIPGANGPEAFYLAYGFRKTGRLRNAGREIEIVLPLRIAHAPRGDT